jgi:predicted TIM-barrel fold metal-dependent hydrolase
MPGAFTKAEWIFERAGLDAVVDLSAQPFSPAWLELLAEARAAGPVKVLVFCGVDWMRVDLPDFGEGAARDLRDCVAAGGRGLKISKALGLRVRTADAKLLPVDDARLDPLWRAAGELRVPVAIHTGDPLAFFQPPDPGNERWEELRTHPSWSFYGGDFPTLEELMAARDRMAAKHPATTFVAVHVGGFPESLESVAASMRAHPNLWIDVAARLPEIGRHEAARARKLFVEFADRVVLGTDLQIGEAGLILGSGGPDDDPSREDAVDYYALHWRYFETEDEDFEHLTPIQGRWKIDAVGLPREVLDKIYGGNARRLLGL